MATIRPTDLPAAASVANTVALVVDTGATVEKATPIQVVDAATPLATQEDAETGTDNVKRVTSLRVKQAIDALGVSAANLASTDTGKGDALIGHRAQIAIQEVETRVQDVLNGLPVPILSGIPPAEHEAILAGTSTYDATADIQALIDKCGSGGMYFAMPPAGTVWLGSKLQVTGKSSIVFTTSNSRYMAAGSLRMLPDSVDDCMFELSESSDIVWRGIGMFGRDGAEASTYLIKATSESGDLDLAVIDCHCGGAETLARIEGRGFLLANSSVVDVANVLQIEWPDPFTPGTSSGQAIGSAMRAYRIFGNRFHSCSGGRVVTNTGAQAHHIRAVQIADNYSDTLLQIWTGHMIGARIVDNIFFTNSSTLAAMIDLPADLNGAGGIINEDNLIAGNYFAGQYDTTYEDGGNPSVEERSILSIGTFRNTSGLKILDNTFNRVSGDALLLTGTCESPTIRGNTFRDVCLGGMRTLTLAGVTGRYAAGETVTGGTSGATGTAVFTAAGTLRLTSVSGTFQVAETVTGGTSGATGTVSTTALTTRYPININSATLTSGLIEGNHVLGATIPPANTPVVRVNGGTVTDLRIGEMFYDSARWVRDNYLENSSTNINNDSVAAFPLKKTNGIVTIQLVSGTTVETAIVSYKLFGTNAASIILDPLSVFTVDVTDTVPTGTSGADTKANLYFVEESGVKKLYIENRRDAARASLVIQ